MFKKCDINKNEVSMCIRRIAMVHALKAVRYCTVFSFIVLLYCESYIYKSNM